MNNFPWESVRIALLLCPFSKFRRAPDERYAFLVLFIANIMIEDNQNKTIYICSMLLRANDGVDSLTVDIGTFRRKQNKTSHIYSNPLEVTKQNPKTTKDVDP